MSQQTEFQVSRDISGVAISVSVVWPSDAARNNEEYLVSEFEASECQQFAQCVAGSAVRMLDELGTDILRSLVSIGNTRNQCS